MQNNIRSHAFHIPVMGIGFTIDTPVKVAHYGISSVISLVDDILIEKMREFYCRKLDIPFQAISNEIADFRAKRITEYRIKVGRDKKTGRFIKNPDSENIESIIVYPRMKDKKST